MKKKNIKVAKIVIWQVNIYVWLTLLVTLCISNAIISIYAIAKGLELGFIAANAIALLAVFFTTYSIITQLSIKEIERIEGGN